MARDGGPEGEPFGQVARRPLSRLVDTSALDQVVEQLREIDRRTGIERTLAIGELILNQFFGGNPAAWRDRRRNKNNSIRRLAVRPDCPFCRSALNEAVGVYVAVVGLPCVRTFGHVYASHVASVLRLPIDERQRMLESAEQQKWSVRELRRRVVLHRRSAGERRGRPPAAFESRALAALRSGLHKVETALCEVEGLASRGTDAALVLRSVSAELETLSVRTLRLADDLPRRRTA